MLYIDRGIDVDPSLEQFLHVLIAFFVPASLGVIMGQFIYKDELWFSLQGLIQVKLLQFDPSIINLLTRQNLQALQQRQRIRSRVSFHIAHYNINTLFFRLVGRLQHGVCLSHACCISKKYL